MLCVEVSCTVFRDNTFYYLLNDHGTSSIPSQSAYFINYASFKDIISKFAWIGANNNVSIMNLFHALLADRKYVHEPI